MHGKIHHICRRIQLRLTSIRQELKINSGLCDIQAHSVVVLGLLSYQIVVLVYLSGYGTPCSSIASFRKRSKRIVEVTNDVRIVIYQHILQQLYDVMQL